MEVGALLCNIHEITEMLTPHTKHKPPRIPIVGLNPLLIFPIICYLPKFKREDIDLAGYSREPLPKSILIGFFVLCQWHRSGIFIVNFEHISHLALLFLLLTLSM